jgi:hypothetical protein
MQMAAIQRLQNSLQWKIDAWKHIQMLYTPAIQLLKSIVDSPSHHTSNTITPEHTNLWLPLALCSKSMAPNAQLLSTKWKL